jgi:hypothetical protein
MTWWPLPISLFDLCGDVRPARSETRLGSPYPFRRTKPEPLHPGPSWVGTIISIRGDRLTINQIPLRNPELIQASGIIRYGGGRRRQSPAGSSGFSRLGLQSRFRRRRHRPRPPRAVAAGLGVLHIPRCVRAQAAPPIAQSIAGKICRSMPGRCRLEARPRIPYTPYRSVSGLASLNRVDKLRRVTGRIHTVTHHVACGAARPTAPPAAVLPDDGQPHAQP